MAKFFNVERITRTGAALYLMHVPGIGMEWSPKAEDAFPYDDLDDAEADALAHGGEVSTFTAPDWREPARLEPHFSIAAE